MCRERTERARALAGAALAIILSVSACSEHSPPILPGSGSSPVPTTTASTTKDDVAQYPSASRATLPIEQPPIPSSFMVGPRTLYLSRGAIPNPVTDATNTREAGNYQLSVVCGSGVIRVELAVDRSARPFVPICDGQVERLALGALSPGALIEVSFQGDDGAVYEVEIVREE